MKKIIELEMEHESRNGSMVILHDPNVKIAMSIFHEDHITDNTDPYHRDLIDRLEAGELVRVALVEITE